jgi:hypothetical protein
MFAFSMIIFYHLWCELWYQFRVFIVYYLFSKHKLQPCFKKIVADLSATPSNTFCWEGFDWSVDKEVLLSDEFMHFYLLVFNVFSLFVKGLRLQKDLFQYILLFVMMNLIAFIACFMFFVIFAKVDWFAWKAKKK